jgi:hypothetical protein
MSSSPSKRLKEVTPTPASSSSSSSSSLIPPPLNTKNEEFWVTVIGGGNSTPIFAALAKTAGYKVAILTRRPSDWSKEPGFVNEDVGYLDGLKEMYAKMDIITSEAKECIPQSEMIFLAGIPVHHNEAILKSIAPFVNKNKIVHIGSICAYGGFNWVASRALGEGQYNLFGTQLIPWTCGTLEYGKKGVIYGAKRILRIATENGKDTHDIKTHLKRILRMPNLQDTDFLACCLWPNNPSLHPPILIGLFEHWDGKTPYDPAKVPEYIYKDLRTHSAEYLVWLDQELCALVAALSKHHPNNPNLKLDYSLKTNICINYQEQVLNSWDTVSCVSSCVAFGKHKIPYTKVEGGVVPTLKHKFFETDLTHGLTTWKDMALMVGMETPIIDRIIRWNQRLNNKEYLLPNGKLEGKDIAECVIPSRMGVTLQTLDVGDRRTV